MSTSVDRCIEAYVARCRKRIPAFVEGHFSLKQTWRLQRSTLWVDLVLAPLNAAWALPHMAIQKVAEALEKVGWLRPALWARRLPPCVKTGYQVKIERLICTEVLEWDRERGPSGLPQGFLKELEAVPELRPLGRSLEREACYSKARRTLTDLLRQFSSGRALVSDAASTILTFGLSWLIVGNASGGLQGIAQGMAQQRAHDRAASKFFLGKRLGSHFYNAFPPAVQESTVWTVLLFLLIGLTVVGMACTIMSDPIRKALGFHRNRLDLLVDQVERELIVLTHKAAAPEPEPSFVPLEGARA